MVKKGERVVLKLDGDSVEGIIKEVDPINSLVIVEVKNLWKKVERRSENRYYDFADNVWCVWYVWDKSGKGFLRDLSKWGLRFVTEAKPPLVNVMEIGFYKDGEELLKVKARLLRVEKMRKGKREMYIVAVGFSEELPEEILDKVVKN